MSVDIMSPLIWADVIVEQTLFHSDSWRNALIKYPMRCVPTKVTAAFPGNNSNSSNSSSKRKHNAVGVSSGRKRKLLRSLSNNVAVVVPATTKPSCWF